MSIALARFEEIGKESEGFDVMFNPASLKVTYTNKVQTDEAGGGSKSDPKQSPQATTAKMETELVFDTTEEGVDVRTYTDKFSKLVVVPKSDKVDPPKNVRFSWGTYAFQGVIESATTTLDFWSAEGVPLRSTVQLTLTSLDGIGSRQAKGTDGVKVSYGSAPMNGALSTALATLCGDANAGRALAAANGLESMRMGGGASAGAGLAVSGGIQLKAAAGFSAGAGFGIGVSAGASAGISAGAGAGFGIGASAGAGASASAGAGFSAGFGASAGIGASAGFGASAGAGAGFGASASAGASAGAGFSFGAGASAGVSASGGAFSGLGVSKSTTLSAQLDPTRLLVTQTTVPSIGAGAQFDVTGRLVSGSSSGLTITSWSGSGIAPTVRIR